MGGGAAGDLDMFSCRDGGDGQHLTRLAGALSRFLRCNCGGPAALITTSAQRREQGVSATLMSIKQTAPATVSLPIGEDAGAPFTGVWGAWRKWALRSFQSDRSLLLPAIDFDWTTQKEEAGV